MSPSPPEAWQGLQPHTLTAHLGSARRPCYTVIIRLHTDTALLQRAQVKSARPRAKQNC